MKIITPENIEWIEAKPENIKIGLFPIEWDEKISIIHARIKPGEIMTEHYHERPQQGHEIYFFYKGGKFRITSNGQTKDFDTQEPFYWTIKNGEKHKIENLGDNILEFQAIYTPKFEMDEVKYLK